MEQGPLDIATRAQLAADHLSRSIVNGAGHPVIDGGTRQLPLDPAPHPNRGLVRKAADGLLNLATCGRRGYLLIDRQHD